MDKEKKEEKKEKKGLDEFMILLKRFRPDLAEIDDFSRSMTKLGFGELVFCCTYHDNRLVRIKMESSKGGNKISKKVIPVNLDKKKKKK